MSHLTRRDFLTTSAVVTASALCGTALTAAEDASRDRSRANKGKIFKADKGGIIGKDEASMIATLERYKKLGFDGLEGNAPGLNVEALNKAMAKVVFPVH